MRVEEKETKELEFNTEKFYAKYANTMNNQQIIRIGALGEVDIVYKNKVKKLKRFIKIGSDEFVMVKDEMAELGEFLIEAAKRLEENL